MPWCPLSMSWNRSWEGWRTGCYHPRVVEHLPKGGEEALLLGAFLRQAVLSLLQDQATIRGLLQQTLANNDVDQLASTLDNLKVLLLSHQRQLMADLAGLFSPELRQRLFPDSPSLTEEGDRLRQRLHRLWHDTWTPPCSRSSCTSSCRIGLGSP